MKKILSFDPDTGEIDEEVIGVILYPKRKNGFQDGWVAMAQQPMMALAAADLSKEAYKVLFAVISQLDFENYILLNQAEIARKLNLQRSHVSEAVKQLETLGVLLRGPKAGRSSSFRLNPAFGWKGSAQTHKEALRERMQAANISGVIDPSKSEQD